MRLPFLRSTLKSRLLEAKFRFPTPPPHLSLVTVDQPPVRSVVSLVMEGAQHLSSRSQLERPSISVFPSLPPPIPSPAVPIHRYQDPADRFLPTRLSPHR